MKQAVIYMENVEEEILEVDFFSLQDIADVLNSKGIAMSNVIMIDFKIPCHNWVRKLLAWKNISHPIVIRNIAKVDKALVDQVSTNITNENMIWGIEQIINNSGLQNYMILPITKSNLIGDSYNKEVTCIENIDDVSIYSVNYASPEFYPININTRSNLFLE